jgi:hypothetical protein
MMYSCEYVLSRRVFIRKSLYVTLSINIFLIVAAHVQTQYHMILSKTLLHLPAVLSAQPVVREVDMHESPIVFEHVSELLAGRRRLWLMSSLQDRAAPQLRISGRIPPADGIGTEGVERSIKNLKALIARESVGQGNCTFGCEVVPTNEKHGQMAIRDEQL